MPVLAGAVCGSVGSLAGLTSTKSSSRTGSPLGASFACREHKHDSRGAPKPQRLQVNMKAIATELATKPTSSTANESSARTVVSIILGGGVGSRLYPLTKGRSKPAVPVGGAYRLIDIPMSNCLNSGVNKVYVLTQFNSRSLNRHILRTYNNGNGIGLYGGGGFVEVLAASQTPDIKNWFRGTADAVRQYVWLLEDVKNKDVEDVVILSGDHLYRMDYMDFVNKHRETNADITISCLPCDDERASDFGLMKIDSTGRVIDFYEKPKGEELKKMKVDTTVLGLDPEEATEKPYIASMGIYVFKKDVLLKLLRWRFPDALDFGSEIIPGAAAEDYNVQAFLFNEYWEDIGTIRSFFEANLSLCDEEPNFKFYQANNPIFTSPRNLPATQIDDSTITKSIISHGCYIEKSTIEHSIVGVRSYIEENVTLKDVLMVGADYYESEKDRATAIANGEVPMGVGSNSVIENAILDKNCRVGKNVKITNKEGIEEANHEDDGWYIRSGIPIVLKNASIPDGFEI